MLSGLFRCSTAALPSKRPAGHNSIGQFHVLSRISTQGIRMALRALVKADAKKIPDRSSVAQLYRYETPAIYYVL